MRVICGFVGKADSASRDSVVGIVGNMMLVLVLVMARWTIETRKFETRTLGYLSAAKFLEYEHYYWCYSLSLLT